MGGAKSLPLSVGKLAWLEPKHFKALDEFSDGHQTSRLPDFKR